MTIKLVAVFLVAMGIVGCFNFLSLAGQTDEAGFSYSQSEESSDTEPEFSRERDWMSAISSENQMTAVISTYQQPICLKRMIQHLRSCPVVGAIRVNWFEEDKEPPPDEIASSNSEEASSLVSSASTPVIYDRLGNKISHRFYPRPFPTEAVFSVDVDTYYSCEALALAFDAWRSHGNSAVVGFHPRYLTPTGYHWATSFKSPFRRNTVFVTKGGIVHRSAFESFFKKEYADLRAFVDDRMTGEDMLMSFVLARDVEAEVFVVCLEIPHHCNVSCSQNKVGSLFSRTSDSRKILLAKLFKYFGSILRDDRGESGLFWQSESDHKYCKSNNDLVGAKPPCDFCKFNEVCPSSVN